jgi:putative transposase
VIHHSDRGGEYSSHALERELRRHGALASMGSVADCFDCEHEGVAAAAV